MFLAPGAKLDKYEVIAPLAVGGMAELYVVRSRGIASFEKLCVLKRILPQHARDDEFVRMFLDEARLAATLHHPNVVQVYDIGVIDGLYYFTMEYVHGQDLAAIIATARGQKRGMKLEHSIGIVAAVAAGLHHAHEQIGPLGTALDIVHRDVSPTNILVSYDGNIKVVDFGIAKAAARRTQTTAGNAKGKLSYMSPEQVRADRGLDRRSDIYSLGIVLYELTTGYPLFRGDSDYLIAEQILGNKIIKPRDVRAQYPEALEAIVMKALAPGPGDRFATARDLQLALEEFARARQLRSSSVGLSEYMTSLFPSQVGEWDIAQRGGVSLIDHVTSMMATRMTSSGITRGDDTSWFKRWAPAIALVALGAAVAGWVVAFQKTDPVEIRESKSVQPAAQPTAGGQPTTSPSAKNAPPAEPVKLEEVDAATIEIDADPVASQPIRRRQRLPKTTVDAAVAPTTPPGLDDRLNPFKPPDKDKPK
jgi:serine/threonine protein kinase